MIERLMKQAREALENGRPHRTIELLKRGVRRDPYWEEGHRMLGEVYLIEVEHAAYALVQFRKLEHIKESLSFEEKVALAWAYTERDFQDRAHALLQDLPERKPDTVQYLGYVFQTESLLERIRGKVTETLDERQDEFYEKNLRQGRDYLRLGNWFHAQQALERALDIKDTPEARLEYGQCLLNRKRYPQAVKMLKSVRSHPDLGSKAGELLEEVYRRLGLKINSNGRERPRSPRSKQIAS